MSELKNPIQPILVDDNGVQRFKKNAIVDYLLDNGGIDLNQIARLDFTDDDRAQFAQLIGYSVSGFADLSYVSEETYNAAELMADEGMTEDKARIRALEEILDKAREG